jgi:hypothetical protein
LEFVEVGLIENPIKAKSEISLKTSFPCLGLARCVLLSFIIGSSASLAQTRNDQMELFYFRPQTGLIV